MRKIHKLTALSLGVLSFATVGLTACKGPTSGGVASNLPERESEYIYNGTHIYTATDTNDYLIKNGKTAYQLVIPEERTKSINIAQKEFSDLFSDATDIEIEVLTEDEVTDASAGKYISLGRTKLLENSGIVIDHEVLDNDGHRIVTKGDDIYICGGADEGTVFGVYTFMGLTFNYETYAYDCMEIDTGVKEKKLKNYNVTDIPDFKFRAHSSDVTMYDAPVEDYDANMYAWRLGYYGKEASRGYYYLPVHEKCDKASPKGASTNARRWFSPEIYWTQSVVPTACEKCGASLAGLPVKNGVVTCAESECGHAHETNYHPEWFSNNSIGPGKKEMQLCFTARGQEDSYELMIQTAVQRIQWTLETYKPGVGNYANAYIMTLTHMDNTYYCSCSACSEIMAANGDSVAAVQIRFMNELARRIDAWFEDGNCPEWKDSFKLLFFAYNHNYEPPVYYNAATKQYELYDPDMKCHDRLIAWFCRESDGQEIFDGDKYFDADETNKAGNSVLQRWSVVADNIHYWNYGTNFRELLVPLDTYQYSTSEMMSFWCNQSDRFWFTQFQDNSKSPNSVFQGLKVYIDSQMAWDTSLEQMELTERWMKGMFKEAAPKMMEIFLTWRSYHRTKLLECSAQELKQPQNWPVGVLNTFLKMFDDAKLAVEHYKTTNPELYDNVCGHIELEAISFLYLMLEVHGRTISVHDRQAYVERVKYDIEWLDLYSMDTEASGLLTEWIEKYE